MPRLIAGGDSFIFGAELSDQIANVPSRSTMSALVASELGLTYQCAAVPGSSNNTIARYVMSACQEHKQTDSVRVFVMWSYFPRYEFRFAYAPNGNHWQSINSWSADIPEFNGNTNVHSYRMQSNSELLKDFARTFYKHVGSDTAFEWYNTLKEIVFLQNYLELNNIPYVFTSADIVVRDNSEFNRVRDKWIEDLYNQIKWDRWIDFEYQQCPMGFVDWARHSNFSIGPAGHPLEDAHIAASTLVKEKIGAL